MMSHQRTRNISRSTELDVLLERPEWLDYFKDPAAAWRQRRAGYVAARLDLAFLRELGGDPKARRRPLTMSQRTLLRALAKGPIARGVGPFPFGVHRPRVVEQSIRWGICALETIVGVECAVITPTGRAIHATLPEGCPC